MLFRPSSGQVVEGIVLDVGWYRTTIRSFEREHFLIPNSGAPCRALLLSGQVFMFSPAQATFSTVGIVPSMCFTPKVGLAGLGLAASGVAAHFPGAVAPVSCCACALGAGSSPGCPTVARQEHICSVSAPSLLLRALPPLHRSNKGTFQCLVRPNPTL